MALPQHRTIKLYLPFPSSTRFLVYLRGRGFTAMISVGDAVYTIIDPTPDTPTKLVGMCASHQIYALTDVDRNWRSLPSPLCWSDRPTAVASPGRCQRAPRRTRREYPPSARPTIWQPSPQGDPFFRACLHLNLCPKTQ